MPVNIVNVTTINGVTTAVSLTSTSEISVVSNANASGKVYKIESLVVANTSTTTAYNITIKYHDAAAIGGNAYPICSTVSVPANASLVVIEKSNGIYLEANSSIGATASSANQLQVVCSYEDIS